MKRITNGPNSEIIEWLVQEYMEMAEDFAAVFRSQGSESRAAGNRLAAAYEKRAAKAARILGKERGEG